MDMRHIPLDMPRLFVTLTFLCHIVRCFFRLEIEASSFLHVYWVYHFEYEMSTL